MKIGIPKALGYYMYFPFWHGFFTDLGIEVIVSDNTTKQIISNGSKLVVSETCLPVKAYMGHVLNLLDKGVNAIYSPSIQSIAPKIYNCSKLRGLPDLVRNVVKKDFLLIEPTLDKSAKNQGLYQFLYESVSPLGITDKKRIKQASKKGWEQLNNYWLMTRAGIEVNAAIKNAINGKIIMPEDTEENYEINIAIMAHAYNLYDNHVSMRAIKKLNKLGARVYTAENLTHEEMENGIPVLNTTLYWANEYEMTGAAGHYMTDKNIDGLLTITAFGCGPDSLMIERMTRFAKRYQKPLLNLTIDEHTGEAGFITRLEAYVDMLSRKKRFGLVEKLNKQIHIQENLQNTDKKKVSV